MLSLLISLVVFWPFFSKGYLPIASDILNSEHHPFKSIYTKEYPFPLPVKNLESFDAIRQNIPWKFLIAKQYKALEWPLWNPTQLSGTPLAGEFLAGPFYPLNILLIISPFVLGFGILAILQVILAFIFIYYFIYLIGQNKFGAFFGGLVFALSGFIAAFFHMNVMVHSLVWVPLALLSLKKLSYSLKKKWFFSLVIAISFIGLAGHMQILAYSVLILVSYHLYLSFLNKDKRYLRMGFLAILLGVLGFSVQLIPAIELLINSVRVNNFGGSFDLNFSSVNHLLLLIAPDYFGNPGKQNYFGGPSYYHEYSFYIGIPTLLFVLNALKDFKRNREILFWTITSFICLVFATENPISKIPYLLNLPLLASVTPTRAYAFFDLAAAVLAGLGAGMVFKEKTIPSKTIFYFSFICLSGLLILFLNLKIPGIFFDKYQFDYPPKNSIALRNLLLPSVLILFTIGSSISIRLFKKNSIKFFLMGFLLLLTFFDLNRQFGLQNGFIPPKSFFPETEITKFLSSHKIPPRIVSLEDKILTPDIGAYYGWENIDGYEPNRPKLYDKIFNEFESGDLSGKSLGKMVSITNPSSKAIDLFGVDYVFSLHDLKKETSDKNYKFLFKEGDVLVYENLNGRPRFTLSDENDTNDLGLSKNGEVIFNNEKEGPTTLKIIDYKNNHFTLSVLNNNAPRLLKTMVINYPGWKVSINGEDQPLRTSENQFLAVLIPSGQSLVTFNYDPLMFKIGLMLSLFSFAFLLIVLKFGHGFAD